MPVRGKENRNVPVGDANKPPELVRLEGTRIDEPSHRARRYVQKVCGLVDCPQLGKRSTLRAAAVSA